MKKLLNFYPAPLSEGIFYHMSQDTDLKEIFEKYGLSSDDDYHAIDFDYIYNQSGLKKISMALYAITQNYVVELEDDTQTYVVQPNGQKVLWDYVLLEVDAVLIRTIIKNRFLRKWKDLVSTLDLDYDTLSPFSIEIAETRKNVAASKSSNSSNYSDSNSATTRKTGTVTDARTIDRDVSNNRTVDKDISDTTDNTTTYENSDNTDNKVFGFNSTDAQNSDKSTQEGSGKTILDGEYKRAEDTTDKTAITEDVSDSNTKTNNLQDTETSSGSSNRSGTGTFDRTDDTTRSITRKGNIGNHTMQELINQQREVLRYQFLREVYSDLDSVLASYNY